MLDFEKNWKTRIIKEAIYSEENEHHINEVSFKLQNIWKPILRESKAKKTTTKTTTSSNCGKNLQCPIFQEQGRIYARPV